MRPCEKGLARVYSLAGAGAGRGFFAALLGLRAAFFSVFCLLMRALSFFCAFLRRIFIDVRLSCFPMKSPLFGN